MQQFHLEDFSYRYSCPWAKKKKRHVTMLTETLFVATKDQKGLLSNRGLVNKIMVYLQSRA